MVLFTYFSHLILTKRYSLYIFCNELDKKETKSTFLKKECQYMALILMFTYFELVAMATNSFDIGSSSLSYWAVDSSPSTPDLLSVEQVFWRFFVEVEVSIWAIAVGAGDWGVAVLESPKAAAAAASNQPFLYQLETTQQRYNYFNSKSILDLHKHDVPMALMEAGCSHLSIKIFQYLDSASLLAASLVCLDWQQVQTILSLESFTGT